MGGSNSGRRPVVDSIRSIRRSHAVAEGAPTMPPGLNERAREIWCETLASAPRGVIRACDSHLLASFCRAAALHEEANRMIDEAGVVIRGAKNISVRSPWFVVAMQTGQAMRNLTDKLGLSPQSRIGLPAGEDSGHDGLERLLGHLNEPDETTLN